MMTLSDVAPISRLHSAPVHTTQTLVAVGHHMPDAFLLGGHWAEGIQNYRFLVTMYDVCLSGSRRPLREQHEAYPAGQVLLSPSSAGQRRTVTPCLSQMSQRVGLTYMWLPHGAMEECWLLASCPSSWTWGPKESLHT